MSTLYVMCGVSGSGKTFYAGELSKRLKESAIVSTDAIRKQKWGDASIQKRPDIIFNEAFNRINFFLGKGIDVIFDATNLTAKDRKKVINEVHKGGHNPKLICIVLSTSLQECVERQNLRDRKVPYEVIKKQYSKMQYPFTDEGWDEIRIIERS